ncbi:MAG TPA: dNTP triphosphohydrolase [bacterium]|nr:dNTP triphosphohydrolase [bacterium]HQG44258.1 dNTP triphosphohydrolase [bacterium]HQI48301.1 dNTP triphosphohydrolase [bacterium]HQJ64191.1 dNTP triphosphohydrolase [bacterium]
MNSALRLRSDLERIEQTILAPYAVQSNQAAATRLRLEPEHPYRTAFQRDRDRIIHSRAFRRLKHKRQVFLTESGDHYRTRITHTLEVSQLARTMARGLGVNEDLAEAIALGHDLGHTPFGHIGEVVLHGIMSGEDSLEGTLAPQDAGGYKHNYQSLRVVDILEKKYRWEGLNLTAAVREGILKHTRLRRDVLHFPDFNLQGLYYPLDHATTIEGQIVAVCDEIAQRTHDLEDGIRAGFVSLDRVRRLPIIGEIDRRAGLVLTDNFIYRNILIRSLVNFLVTDVMEATLERIDDFIRLTGRTDYFDTLLVWFSERVDPLQEELDRFIASEIIQIASEERSDNHAREVIRTLFRSFYLNPGLLPDYRLAPVLTGPAYSGVELDEWRAEGGGFLARSISERQLQADDRFLRAICDHIAGMTDNYAELEYRRIGEARHDR